MAYLGKKYVSPSTKFKIGDTVKVTTTPLYVRTDPPVLAYKGKVSYGATGKILDGPKYGTLKGKKGKWWFWKVDYGSITGWSAENYLKKAILKQDLTVTSVSAPSSAKPGDSITVSFTVKNKGKANAGRFKVKIYLSKSSSPWGTDIYLGDYSFYSLNSGSSSSKSKTVTIPSTTTPRKYYVTVYADANKQISESDENNNIGSTYPSMITIGQKNRKPTAYIDSISPNPAKHGQTVSFKGHGTDPDGDSITAYNWRSSINGFLSSSKSFSKSDLSVGTHTIYFKVKDSRGLWSDKVTRSLTIEKPTPKITGIVPSQPTVSKSRIPVAISGNNFVNGAKVTFKAPDGKEWLIPRADNSYISISSNKINVKAGFYKSGTWKVWVINPDGKKSNEFSFTVKPIIQTGSITVTTNLDSAKFTITGPKTYHGSGKSWSTSDAPAGTYTITYGEVSGYTSPTSEKETLSAGGSITFSGTYVPSLSENPFNYKGAYELNENKLRNEEKPALPYVMNYASEYTISPALIMAVIRQESNFNPDAKSPKDAVGYMQVTYIAAKDAGYKGTKEQWLIDGLNSETSIKYGTKYLKILYGRYKDSSVYNDALKNVLSSYYSGHPTKDSEWYANQVIEGRDIIDGQRRGYKFFLSIRLPTPTGSNLGNQAASLAEEIIGAPYLWGGKGWDWEKREFVSSNEIKNGYRYHWEKHEKKAGLDCSGLSFWPYNKAWGATKYRDSSNPIYEEGANGQWTDSERLKKISKEDLKHGDLLFLIKKGKAEHVIMYVGGGYVVHAEGVIFKKIVKEKLSTVEARYKNSGYTIGYGRVKAAIPSNPPNQPTALSQHKSKGITVIPKGGTTSESTVVFKGTVSDPDGDQVKLQIELRGLDEYGGSFIGTHTQESDLVNSGSQASVTVHGLIEDNYHWQARTVDKSGKMSQWVEFGDNPISEIDFTVSVPKNIAQIIERETKEKVPITVEGKQYIIVTLKSYIDPGTLEVKPTSEVVKVYVDAEEKPVSDEVVIRKIREIDSARYLQKKGIVADSVRGQLELIKERRDLHRIIRLDEIILNAAEKALATSIRTYITQGVTLKEDVVSSAEDLAKEICSDPVLVLEAIIYMDFEEAKEEFNKFLKIDQGGSIDDYETAHEYLYHLYMGWALGGGTSAAWNTLDKIDELDKTTWGEIIEFGAGTLDKILGGHFGKFQNLLDKLGTADLVKEYAEKRINVKPTVNKRFPFSLGRHGQYTLNLAKQTKEEKPVPDLTLSPAYVEVKPLSIEAGKSVSVTFTVKNKGNAPSGPFDNRVSLDLDDKWGIKILLGKFDMNSLDGGSSQQMTVKVPIPKGIAPGDYYVTVYADAFRVVEEIEDIEGIEGNNIGSTTPQKLTVIEPPKIDFTVTSVDAPSSTKAGEPISIDFTTVNQGISPSGSFTNRVFLATTHWGTNIPLGNFDMASLDGSASRRETIEVTISSNISPGDYYITVFTDGFRAIAETKENNNIGSTHPNKISIGAANQPPSKPSKPSGPTTGEIGISYSYSTVTTDPNSDNVYYWFDWGDNTNSGWIRPYSSGTSGSASKAWSNPDIYDVKAKAKDVHGAESSPLWSDSLSVCINGSWENDPSNPCKKRRLTCYGEYEKQDKPDGTTCDDSQYCTVNDVCTAGVCSGSPRDCSALDDQCNVGVCNEATDSCVKQPRQDGTDCGSDYYDDWVSYCKGEEVWKHRQFRDFYCEGGLCVDHTSWVDEQLVENCNDHDGWVDTGDMRWIDDPGNECKEKEQREQKYHDYMCSGGNCDYSVTDTKWINTGITRNKDEGTICGCTANNTLKECSDGSCSDTGICNSTICNADIACDGKKPEDPCDTNKKCNSNCKCSPSGTTESGELSTISFDPSNPKTSAGSTTTINITLDKVPNGLSGYNLTVSLSNTSVAEIVSVNSPSWAALYDNSTLPADSVWIKATDLTDQVKSGATDVNLGTLTFRGDNRGTSDIVITVTKMDDDKGYSINPNTISGQIEVTIISVSVIPIPEHTYSPTDTDSDGLYEDLNGNGIKDFDDIVQFFRYIEWIQSNEQIHCFDFNGNGRLDFNDIVELFEGV